jgi:hypothetical protein
VAEQRLRNIHVRDGISELEFVTMRKARDVTLAVPTLAVSSQAGWPSNQRVRSQFSATGRLRAARP